MKKEMKNYLVKRLETVEFFIKSLQKPEYSQYYYEFEMVKAMKLTAERQVLEGLISGVEEKGDIKMFAYISNKIATLGGNLNNSTSAGANLYKTAVFHAYLDLFESFKEYMKIEEIMREQYDN